MNRGRRVRAGVVSWVVAAAGVRLFVAQPEHCPDATDTNLRTAINQTIDWAVRTQQPDGRWLYRYDVKIDRDIAVYEMVRHAGLAMALHQAAAAGFPQGEATAERADAYARTQVIERDGLIALAGGPDGEPLEVGASALWLVGLTFDPQADASLLRGLGRFLVANIFEDGSVAGTWDPATGQPVRNNPSPFYTGETMWALARLNRRLPNEGWDRAVDRISQFVVTRRDAVERWFPPIPDHWVSHAFAEVTQWRALSEAEGSYARRLAQLESLQVRYESQRTNSTFSKLTRGPQALGAGVGAMTEALAALWATSGRVPSLKSSRAAIAARAECGAGMLVQRQIDATEAAKYARPDRVEGTWIHGDDTQIDDQQHSLSGLLGVLEIVDA